MKKFAILCVAMVALLFVASSARAQHGYGGWNNSGGWNRGYSNYGYNRFGGHYDWHNTSPYDYHPGSFQRHYNHFDYVPGHYDYHRSGHYDWHGR